jgi:hypothetical protein
MVDRSSFENSLLRLLLIAGLIKGTASTHLCETDDGREMMVETLRMN